ncbi:MAG TPA: sugar MFS transporter [Terriglobales bacterium]|nr:sugar MFS transporter [Terriglobales bacterium]
MAIPTTNTPLAAPSGSVSSNRAALTVVTTLFFVWGFVTALNDVLVPHFKAIFGLKYAGASLIQTFFFAGYFIFSIPAAKLIDKAGYKKTMVVGVIVMAGAALLFIPCASVASYPLFLAALVVLACGITALQVAANAYVAVLGPPETSSSRLNLAQAFNSLGTTIAPWLGAAFILSAHENPDALTSLSGAALKAYQIQEASSVKIPYLLIGVILILLAISIAMFKLPPLPGAERKGKIPGESIWKHPQLVLGAVGIFVYVGAEVSIGSYLINYFSQANIGNISEIAAAKYVSLYWGGAMVGRFIGSALLQKFRTGTILGLAAIASCLLVTTSILTLGHMAMYSIILVGLFNSVMFPSIFTMGIAELGPLTGDGSGLLVMAIVGGALIPLAQGRLADMIGLHHAFILPAVCYLYIIHYAFRGSRPVPVTQAA